MIDAKVLSRSFTYNGVKLPDPDPRMTPEEVKAAYSHSVSRAGHSRNHGAGSQWRPLAL